MVVIDRRKSRGVAGVLGLLLGCLALGCEAPTKLLGSNDERMVYLVLSADPEDGDSTLYALVVGGTDEAQLRYANVTTFSMRRVVDGATFDWQVVPGLGVWRSRAVDLRRWQTYDSGGTGVLDVLAGGT